MTTIYEGAAADGMNERGLVADMLYLADSKDPATAPGDRRSFLPNTVPPIICPPV